MRFPNNKTLAKIAVYGAVASISAVMFMRHKIEEQIRKSNYFRLALENLRQSKGAVRLLGEPIKEVGFDLSDGSKNFADGKIAHFEVSVKGPKDKGKMFFHATRSDDRGWQLDRLELEVNCFPEKRFIVKTNQSSDQTNEGSL